MTCPLFHPICFRNFQIIPEFILLLAGSSTGLYYRHMTEGAHRRTFVGTRTCIESRVKLECEKEQQEQLLLSVIPAYIAAEVSYFNHFTPMNLERLMFLHYSVFHVNFFREFLQVVTVNGDLQLFFQHYYFRFLTYEVFNMMFIKVLIEAKIPEAIHTTRICYIL